LEEIGQCGRLRWVGNQRAWRRYSKLPESLEINTERVIDIRMRLEIARLPESVENQHERVNRHRDKEEIGLFQWLDKEEIGLSRPTSLSLDKEEIGLS
jgi:energy-converting hydrogenase A subunit M